MTNLILSFGRDRRGATAIEYGLIAAGIGVAIMLVIFTFGDQFNAFLQQMVDLVNSRDV